MKKIIYSIILSFFLSSVAYTENSNDPETNKIYKCTAFAGGNDIVELNFSRVKMEPFKIENISKVKQIYLVEHKTVVLGKNLQTFHYAISTQSQIYFFVLNSDFKELTIQMFVKDSGWKYFEIFLSLNDDSFKKIEKYSDRFGYLKKDYEKIASLSPANFNEEISILKALKSFTVDIHKSGEVKKYMDSQTAYNCD